MAELRLDWAGWEGRDGAFPGIELGSSEVGEVCSSYFKITCKWEATAQVAASERNLVQPLRPQ